MSSLKRFGFYILLLSIFFTGKKEAKWNRHVFLEKYTKDIFLPYHTYMNLPGRDYDFSLTSNLLFTGSLLLNSHSAYRVSRPELILAVTFVSYFCLFSILTYRAIKSRNIAKALFFVSTSIFNAISPFIIPEYVFIIWRYNRRYKVLLKLNLETGFYEKRIDPDKEFVAVFKTIEEKRIPRPADEAVCTICISDYKDVENKKIVGLDSTDSKGNKVYHYFHQTCISEWYKNRGRTCPDCRGNISEDEIKEEAKGSYNVNGLNKIIFKFTINGFFMSMVYATLTLCRDNFDKRYADHLAEQYYNSIEIILLRLGGMVASNAKINKLRPFIGFLGFSMTFFSWLRISVLPTYIPIDDFFPNRILLDICLTLLWPF